MLQRCKNVVRQCPPNFWEFDPEGSVIFFNCFCSYSCRHFSIHLSATKIVHISTSVTPAHTDGKIKILCSEYWIIVLAFLTELAIFQVEGGMDFALWIIYHFIMDYIPFLLIVLGETAREMRAVCALYFSLPRAPLEGSGGSHKLDKN